MPKLVEIPSIGTVEFPDEMNDEQITTAIQKNILPNAQSNNAEKISKGESVLQGIGDTLTFGTLPKVGGAIGAGIARFARPGLFEEETFADTYKKGRDTLRERQQQSFEQNPLSYASGALGGGALNPFGRGVNTVKGAIGYGGAQGLLHGLGSSDKGEVGKINLRNIEDAAVEGVIGAATGGALQGVFNTIAPRITGATKLTPEQKQAVKLSEQFKVPLSLGQASQNIAQQISEDLLAGGAKGAPAANIMNAGKNLQQEAFQEAAQNLRSNIGKGNFIEKGQSVKPAIDKIVKDANVSKRAINSAYQKAKDAVSFLDKQSVKKFSNIAQAKFTEEALTPENAPAAFSQITSFKKLFDKHSENIDGISFKRLEAWRQGLNRSYKSSKGQDRYGIDLVRKQFDDYLDNTIEKALIKGDKTVLEQFKNARNLAAEWNQRYNTQHKTEFGKKFIKDIVVNASESREPFTYAMITDKIFGANKYGFKPQAVNIIKEIKNQVGADSPEFNGLKLDAVQKIIKPLLNQKGKINFNNPAVQTYKNNLLENKAILKEILTDTEYRQLSDFGDLGSLLYQSRKSIVNPSQSGLYKALSELPIVSQAIAIGGKLPYIKDVPDSIYASHAKKAISPDNLEASLSKLNKNTYQLPKNAYSHKGSLVATSLFDALSKQNDEK